MIVVDTPVPVGFFRGTPSVVADEFERLEREEIAFAVPAVCCQELSGSGKK